MNRPRSAQLQDRLGQSPRQSFAPEAFQAIPPPLPPPPQHPRRSQSDRLPIQRNRSLQDTQTSASVFSLGQSRENLVAMDRKRRLTENMQDSARRRTMSGGFTDRETTVTRAGGARSGHQERPTGPGQGATVIDLTSSPPLQPQAQTASRRESASNRSHRVPRWQPDSEVNACPICHRQFTFYFRRHHCRKCGRVVCGECSPHQITIPKQYIVRQPGYENEELFNTPAARDTLSTEEDDEEVWPGTFQQRPPSTLGGEKVRLCNPCVPDPQPELPNQDSLISPRPPTALTPTNGLDAQTFAPYSRHSAAQRFQADRALPPPPPPRNQSHFGAGMPGQQEEGEDEDSSSLEVHTSARPRRDLHHILRHDPSTNPGAMHDVQRAANLASLRDYHLRRSRGDHLPFVMPPAHPGNPQSAVTMQHMLAAQQAAFIRRPSGSTQIQPSRIPHSSYFLPGNVQPNLPAPQAHLPVQPRPRLREEDICPICRHLLPAKGENGDESAREGHIMDCISRHDTSSNAAPQPPLQPSHSRGASYQDPSNAPRPPTRHGSTSASVPLGNAFPVGPPPPYPISKNMALVRFTATEKDCIATTSTTAADKLNATSSQEEEDGRGQPQAQECSICMVEYEVGDRLARLECWCKFHEECILGWFNKKGRGECPVHREF